VVQEIPRCARTAGNEPLLPWRIRLGRVVLPLRRHPIALSLLQNAERGTSFGERSSDGSPTLNTSRQCPTIISRRSQKPHPNRKLGGIVHPRLVRLCPMRLDSTGGENIPIKNGAWFTLWTSLPDTLENRRTLLPTMRSIELGEVERSACGQSTIRLASGSQSVSRTSR
jgi:hypothetical protein